MMRAKFNGGSGRKVVVILCLCLTFALLLLYICTREHTLNGLLVDLELAGPDPSRHGQLQHVLTHELQAEIPSLRNTRVTLRYVHFADLTKKDLDARGVDFVILSPQGTPWHKYRGEAGHKLELAEELVKELVLKGETPILGICGGHQFLALAFGGGVDFIDPKFMGSFPDRYPENAASGTRGGRYTDPPERSHLFRVGRKMRQTHGDGKPLRRSQDGARTVRQLGE